MKITRRTSLLGLAAALVLALAFLFDWSKWLRGGNGWRWNYEPVPFQFVLPLLLAVIAYLAGSFWLLQRRRIAWVIAWAIIGGVVLSVLGVGARAEGDILGGLFLRSTGLFGTGQYWMAMQIDWASGAWLDWPAQMRAAGGHLSNLPPGVPMIYALLADAFGDNRLTQFLGRNFIPYQCHITPFTQLNAGWWGAAAFGMALPLMAALSAIPLFGVARRMLGLERARLAVLWWPLIPALASFSPSWNTVYPWITLMALWGILRATDKGRFWWAWALMSGLMTGIGTFLNFAFSPLPLIMGCVTLALVCRQDGWWRGLLRGVSIGLAYAVGMVLPWLVYYLVSGWTPFDLLATSFEFHLTLERPYAYWVVWHVADWLLWSGLPLALVALLSAVRAIRLLRASHKISEIQAVTLAAWAGMLLLTLSGTARGETGRVWLTFVPFLLLGAADGLREHVGSSRDAWLRVAAAQALFVVVFVAVLAAVNTSTAPRPEAKLIFTPRPVDAVFSTSTGIPLWRLTGWDWLVENDTLRLALTLDPISQPIFSYVIGGLWVGENGETLPAGDVIPTHPDGGLYPTTCLAPDQEQSVYLLLRRPPAGDYYLSIAAFGDAGGPEGRLTVTTPAEQSVQVGLGPITIP
jgi:hypothetical protein